MLTNTFLTGAATIQLILSYYANYYNQTDLAATLEEMKPDFGLPKIEIFDFVIVGGGTAGCLLASRLSERYTVLLLERGGPPPPPTKNPYYGYQIEQHPGFNDHFSSTPQKGIKGADGGLNNVTTGRMLGGSGSHNGNIYNRGSPHDYDNYAKLFNDESWKYENILKYYKRFESFGGIVFGDQNITRSDYFGQSGPIHVETNLPPILPTWFQAGIELGYKVQDPNALQEESFTPMVKSAKNGRRSSTYTGYLKKIMGTRSNLRVLMYSDVDEVLINENKTAYGVVYKRHGMPQIAHASKEVILSPSTFTTPIILIKSGVGPKDVLLKAKIPVKHHLPGVGKNLRDHAGVFLEFTATNSSDELLPVVSETGLEKELLKFQSVESSGFYSRNDLGHAQAFFVSQVAKKRGQTGWPDIQVVFKQTARVGKKSPQRVTMHVIVNRLESQGEVIFDTDKYLQGVRDAVELAKIDYNLLTDEEDRLVLMEAINHTLKIMEETTPMRALGMNFTQAIPSVCQTFPYRSPEFWTCYMQQMAGSWWHQSGTCKMGQKSDEFAVVDSKFRVFGINKLRVVDASIYPVTLNANINAATIMIAEKAAEDLFNEYAS
ncbi:oxygen-dependent choline dehydrogenase [Folsomia candida]|uniref:oxygen-dependent choline dehydrogenase n=1 Tax=Folsomia candida TaxID=158441 RepID=UPI000B908012|nr:oxygen-dependent choline dehydrogenase [Folsomia candida]